MCCDHLSIALLPEDAVRSCVNYKSAKELDDKNPCKNLMVPTICHFELILLNNYVRKIMNHILMLSQWFV